MKRRIEEEKFPQKKLCVIMPVYNGIAYLREAVDSVLGQSYRNIELILVDDGSTDGSTEICEEYAGKDSRVRLLRQKNAGGQVARNTGLKNAQGDYIAFVDADDRVLPDIYAAQIEAMEQMGADIAACGFTREEPVEPGKEPFVCVDGSSAIMDSICGLSDKIRCGGYLWNKVYRRELIEGHYFNEGINLGEDGLFNLLLAEKMHKLAATNTVMYFYRKNAASMTKTHARSFERCAREYREYHRLLLSVQDARVQRYVKRMLANCCLKAAEAAVREKKPTAEIREIQNLLQENPVDMRNRKAQTQCAILKMSIPLYIVMKKGMLLLNRD